jgi:hypothetical protein
MRSLLLPLLSLAAAFSIGAPSASHAQGAPPIVPPPQPGRYTGLVTLQKLLFNEGIGSKVTMKAHAHVAEVTGALTIVTDVPESPIAAADNPESNVIRGIPQPDGTYLLDNKHRATVTTQGKTFQVFLSTQVGAPPDSGEPVKVPMSFEKSPASINIDLKDYIVFPRVITVMHYRFTPLPQPSARRSR